MRGGFQLGACLCFLSFVTISVRCQERITIFSSSSGENEVDYEKPPEKSTIGIELNNEKVAKHSSKALSVELVTSTKPNQEKTNESTTKRDDLEFHKNGVRIVTKSNDKRASNSEEFTGKEENKVSSGVENERKNAESRNIDNRSSLEDLSKKSPGIVCPERDLPRPLFAPSCSASRDCAEYGRDMLCCDKTCVRGVKPPRIQTQHDPIFFGIIHRKCPADPLPELSEVKECKLDSDCFPRICCTEALQNGQTASYCRTPEPLWDNLPIPNQVLDPLKTLVAYMQCTPPPPPIFDLFPKPCQNPLDCFPNLCCQERGKRYCRPPKRSILALVADLGTRLIPEDTAKKFIERISR